jgi:chloramphenicol 3-O-phosphotransferase
MMVVEVRMDTKVLFLVRGLPGSGKSSIARAISAKSVSADDFFMQGDKYVFDPKKLGDAHAYCQNTTAHFLSLHEVYSVSVANTFTCRWEMEPYLLIAEKVGARIVVIDTFDAGLDDAALSRINVHGVPVESIAAMRARWEADWRGGNPVPPWMRK